MTNSRTLHNLKNNFILDMHVHVAGIGIGSGCHISPSLLDNWRYDIYLQAFNTCRKEIEKLGDAIVIKRIGESLEESRYVDGALLLALDKAYDPASHEPNPDLTEVYIPSFTTGQVSTHTAWIGRKNFSRCMTTKPC